MLDRLATVLAADSSGNLKTAFVQTGGLQLIQEFGEEPNSPYQSSVSPITNLFPIELVNRYSPAYNRALLDKLAAGGARHQNSETAVHAVQSKIQQPIYNSSLPANVAFPTLSPAIEEYQQPTPIAALTPPALEPITVAAVAFERPPPLSSGAVPPPDVHFISELVLEHAEPPAIYLSTIEEEAIETINNAISAENMFEHEPITFEDVAVGVAAPCAAGPKVEPEIEIAAPVISKLPSPRPQPQTPRKPARSSEKEVEKKEKKENSTTRKSPAPQPPVATGVAPPLRKSVLTAALPRTPRDILPSNSAE